MRVAPIISFGPNGGRLVLWKVRLNWESGGRENNVFKKKWISTGNHFEEADFIRFDSSRVRYHLILGFRLSVHCKLIAVWWMTNRRSFCFIIACHNFATLENRFTYQCPSSWPVVITMKKKLAGTWKKIQDIGRSRFMATSLQPVKSWKKSVEVVKGQILAGWAQKFPEPWYEVY